jgi:hypothetical protein
LSRLRILTLFAALIALASLLGACGGGSSSDDPQTIVDEATFQGIESGDIDLSLDIGTKGEKSGQVDVSLSGPFQSESEAELPELDLTAKANGSIGGEKVDFDGGLTLLGSKAYVAYEGTEYAVDSTTFNFVKSMLRQQSGGGSSEVTACQEAASDLEVADFIEGLSDGSSADVGGTDTTKVSGELNASGALDALSELIDDPACSEQLSAAGGGPLPTPAELDKAKGTVQDSVKNAHVDLYVGDDHIIRRIEAKATIEPPAGSDNEGVERVDLELDLTLTGVNEDQEISAPQATKPLSSLFLKLGINPIELLGALNGQGAGGLSGLLEGLGGIGGSSGDSGGGDSGGGRQAYLECLQGASTPVDLQNCTGLLQ